MTVSKKVSEIKEKDLQDYLKLEYPDPLLGVFLNSAKEYIKNYTGMSDEQMDLHTDIVLVVYVLVSDMYDNREYVQKNSRTATTPNMLVKSILDMYSYNLL